MKPLTKREKILLYALAVIAVVAAITVLLIQPAMERADALDAEILDKQTTVDSVRSSLLTEQGLREEIDRDLSGVAKERAYFLPILTNNELDEYITGLLQTHGLTALSLAISTVEEQTEEGEQSDNSGIYTYRVNTAARGTMRQFMLLVDTVRELDGVRIAAITNTQDALQTAKPTATPRPNRKAKATPVPLFTTPTPAPAEYTYTMEILFCVQEYVEGAATSVALNREE